MTDVISFTWQFPFFFFLKKNVTLIVFAVQHRKNTPINQAFREANTLKKAESRVVRTCKTTNGKQYKLSSLRLLTTVSKQHNLTTKYFI